MKIAITGSTGLIGSALVRALRGDGHEVLRLVRAQPRQPDEVRWDPTGGDVDVERLHGVDAAVHLAGAGVGDRRWTDSYKRTIRDSRVLGTRTLSRALASLAPRPAVLLCGSAIGWYGDTGTEAVDEGAASGDTFLAGVVREWESATSAAEEAGIRVVHPRTGLVMAESGGALGRMMPIFRLGLGGKLGTGRQFWSWITLQDEVRAAQFLLTADDVTGPVNLTAPEPVTNAEVTSALARALHRPAVVPVPEPALRLALGEFAGEVLMSQRVLPRRLLESGFEFSHPDIDSAAHAVT